MSRPVSSSLNTVTSVWKAIERTASWQEAILLVSVSILVAGVAFVIIASLIPSSPASAALSMVGLKFLEIGLTSTAVSAISVYIKTIFNKKKNSAEKFSQDLLQHTISVNPRKNVEETKMKKAKKTK